MLYPRKGVSDLARMDPAAVEAKYGVGPERYRDLAALVGETSDNLPGVPGVGPKTAAKWINQYGGVDGVVAHVDEIKGKAGDSLREHLADVMRNYELNRLVCRPGAAAAPRGRRAGRAGTARRCTRSSTRCEFRVLRDRLYQYLEAVEPEAEAGFDLAGEVLRARRGGRLARRARAAGRPGRGRRRRHVRPGHRRR